MNKLLLNSLLWVTLLLSGCASFQNTGLNQPPIIAPTPLSSKLNKIPELDGEITEHILNRYLVRGAKIKALLRCNGIWVSGNKFGCTWKAEQIQITVPVDIGDEFAFRESDDEDNFIESDSDDSD